MINKRHINLKPVWTHDSINTYACLDVSESVRMSNKPLSCLSITPLVVRDDATPLRCYAWCGCAVTWSFTWGKRCRGGSAPSRILIPGGWWAAVWWVVVFECSGQWVWRRNKPWFMMGQWGVSWGQRNRKCQILQTYVATAGLHMKVKGGNWSFVMWDRICWGLKGKKKQQHTTKKAKVLTLTTPSLVFTLTVPQKVPTL